MGGIRRDRFVFNPSLLIYRHETSNVGKKVVTLNAESEIPRKSDVSLQVRSLRSKRTLVVCIVCCCVVLVAGCFRSFFLLSLLSYLAGGIVAIKTVGCVLRSNLQTSLLAISTLGFVLSIWTTEWPLRTAFFFSKPALEVQVDVFNAGNESHESGFAGIIYVRSIEIHGDEICCWTKNRFDRAGFVKQNGTLDDFGDLRIKIPLGDSWFFIVDD